MTFPVLAFFSRTMRVQARSWRTYAFRGALALLLWAILGFNHATRLISNAPGRAFFRGLVVANLWVLCTVALVYFATAITEEKEEMTIGLLKLAGLNPLSILMGKSTSRLLAMGMLLLVQFPFAVLAVTLGGVSIIQVVAAYVMLLAFTWFLCNLSLVCSVVTHRGRSAGGLAGLALIAFFLVPWVVQGLVTEFVVNRGIWKDVLPTRFILSACQSVINTSPFTRVEEVMSIGFAGPVIGYQVIASLVWGLAFFLLAWGLFGPCTRRQKLASPARGLIPKSGVLLRPLGVGRAWHNALAWKEFHFMTGGKTKIIVKSVLFALAVVAVGALMYGIETNFGAKKGPHRMKEVREISGVTLTISILMITVLEMGVYASRLFSSEVKWKTLSAVMGLPASVGRLVWGKIKGCLPTFAPNLALLCVGVFLGREPIGDVLWSILSEEEGFMVCVYLCAQVPLFLNLTAFLSLYVKWGALVLAAMLQFIAQYVVVALLAVLAMSTGGSDMLVGVMLFMSTASIGLAFMFGFLMTVRLAELAAREA